MSGPQGQAVAQGLRSSLEVQRHTLDQKLKTNTLDRPDFALAQAYLDAVEAAQAFLDSASIRR